jgi:hypothetical protein
MDNDATHELLIQITDDDDQCLYMIEHWFRDRPPTDTVAALFEEAKRDYDALYPDSEAEDFSVEIRRIQSRDAFT